jgi:protein gp37
MCADKSKIEWTDATWNPVVGCSKISDGCKGCCALRDALRLAGNPNEKIRELYSTVTSPETHNWTGVTKLNERHLEDPLRWKRPRRIFVNYMSDLFHESIPDEWIDKIFAVMALAPQHTFQILTKRPERMQYYFKSWLTGVGRRDRFLDVANHANIIPADLRKRWPLPNVWIGVSVEDQKTADERIPLLLQTPAAVRWISAEPLLGPINIEKWLCNCPVKCEHDGGSISCSIDGYLDWVVPGGESGADARPMHPNWARSLRDQSVAAGVPFLFKQWGEWSPEDGGPIALNRIALFNEGDNGDEAIYIRDLEDERKENWAEYQTSDDVFMYHVGKKAAGRMLDGREWNEYPDIALGGA